MCKANGSIISKDLKIKELKKEKLNTLKELLKVKLGTFIKSFRKTTHKYVARKIKCSYIKYL